MTVVQDSRHLRNDPGHPNESTVLFRASARDAYPGPYGNQMPPLSSHRVPIEGAEALARWIGSL